MKLVWVKGSSTLSKLIMWGLKEPVSHFAIVFDDKIVFHSDLLGVRIAWYTSFLKTHKVIYEKDFSSATIDMQEEAYQAVITKFDGHPYDYKAFLYFMWRALLNRFLNMPFPSKNKLGESNSFLCTEVASILPDYIVPQDVKSLDLGMLSPYKLWKLLNNVL